MKIRIKVCGITNIKDALSCAKCGVDGLGFIFCKSKRHITPDHAGLIIRQIDNNIFKVGVFQNQTVSQVAKTAEISGINFIQLHGNEDIEYIKNLKILTKDLYQIIKVIPIDDSSSILKDNDLKIWDRWPVSFFLLDTKVKDQCGGLGRTFPWKFAAQFSESVKTPYFLAGGIGPDNIKEALNILSPWAVDVNSGVEKAPGIKDIKKVEQAVRIIKERDNYAIT